MTVPDGQPGEGTQAQILLKLGEISTQVAVITQKLEAIPDHEQRIRANERAIATLRVEQKTSRDTQARLWAAGASLAAAGSAVAAWIAIARHH